MGPHHLLSLSGIVVALLTVIWTRYVRSSWRHLPPGPRGLPILGNALQLMDRRWLFSPDCRSKHGDMIYMTALGQRMLFLNTQKAAADLLDRKSSIYIDRPHFIVASEFVERGMAMALARSTDLWRRMRRAAQDSFSKNVVKNYHEIQAREAIFLAHSVLADPVDMDKHMRRTSASMIMSVVYDLPPIEVDDNPNVAKINKHNERVLATTQPGAHWVEFFPWLKHVPSRFAKWKRTAEQYHQEANTMFHELFSKVQNDVNEIDRPSMSATLIQQQKRFGLSNVETVWTAGDMFTAASETTAGGLMWWCAAMLAYPETQVRAQGELDAVVGRGRLPSFADFPHLPYIQAMVKEVLRWRPSVRLGVPHVSISDDWYEGVFIPRGTLVIPNIWQCNHDPALYGADAARFNPARFLDKAGGLVPGPPDAREEGHMAYGYGRRACVGKYLANNSLFIDIATLLWAMKFERKKDAKGNEEPVNVDDYVGDSLVNRPVSFSCHVVPRFPEAAAMLSEARELQR
ncbi:cytochrome P450 [Gloeopeniophorella convolvens]|nr:cytochrome P450 [Gloeopeniophorella convolvens]